MNASPDRLPPALPAMWRLLKLGYRHEPGMLLAAFGLSLLAALPDALLALWLKLLGQGLLAGDRRLLLTAALGLGLSAVGTWFLGTVSTRVQRRFRDKVTVALEAHVARLQASLDRVGMLPYALQRYGAPWRTRLCAKRSRATAAYAAAVLAGGSNAPPPRSRPR